MQASDTTRRRGERSAGCARAAAVAAGLLLAAAGARADLPVGPPDLTAYSNAVMTLAASLAVTNFANYKAELEEVRRTTVALDEELFRFRGRCRAALAAARDRTDPLHAALTEAGFSDYRRGVALIDGRMLDLNRDVDYERLLALTHRALTNALGATVQAVRALDAGWQRLRKPDLPASLEISVRAPKRAAHGQLVELPISIWNAGDRPATGLFYRLKESRKRLEPALPPAVLGTLGSGEEEEHVILLRMPETGAAVGYGITVGCDSGSATAVDIRIALEGP